MRKRRQPRQVRKCTHDVKWRAKETVISTSWQKSAILNCILTLGASSSTEFITETASVRPHNNNSETFRPLYSLWGSRTRLCVLCFLSFRHNQMIKYLSSEFFLLRSESVVSERAAQKKLQFWLSVAAAESSFVWWIHFANFQTGKKRGDGDGLELICILFNVFFSLFVDCRLLARLECCWVHKKSFLLSFREMSNLVTINKQKI